VLTETVCVPAWLLAMLAVGAIGTEALMALRRRQSDSERSE